MSELKCPNCGKIFTIDEDEYASIAKQIRDREFEKELKTAKEAEEIKIKLAVSEAEKEFNEKLSKKEEEILKLTQKIDTGETDKQLAIVNALKEKDEEIAKQKESISELNNKISTAALERKLSEDAIRSEYDTKLRMTEEQVEYYKDLKAKLSTKAIGESLEKHCETEFNKLRATGFKNAYFEKDNKVSKETGSKGDYIFKDYTDDGLEYISIMFEMKNEADTTSTKKTNESFLKELDKDRTEKKCEYAVLVSLLEQDNDLYNEGIVDVSYKYEKMYVIRPQFFIPLITILRNAALNSVEYQKELALVKAQNIDITNFENDVNEFKEKFGRNYKLASDKFKNAIDEIDKSIDHLNKIKDALLGAENNLRLANNRIDDIAIKKLTKNNPTMKAKFEELKESEEVEVVED